MSKVATYIIKWKKQSRKKTLHKQRRVITRRGFTQMSRSSRKTNK